MYAHCMLNIKSETMIAHTSGLQVYPETAAPWTGIQASGKARNVTYDPCPSART